jgi:hypothetical protein
MHFPHSILRLLSTTFFRAAIWIIGDIPHQYAKKRSKQYLIDLFFVLSRHFSRIFVLFLSKPLEKEQSFCYSITKEKEQAFFT